MTTRRLFLASVAALAAMPAFAADPAAKAEKPRVLFITQSKGFVHGPVRREGQQLAGAEIAMTQLAQQTGKFEIDCSQEADKDFTKKNLQNYDVVMFYTTGDLPIKQEDRDYFFNEWLKQPGHGFIGVHSASDTFHNYEPYWDMVGGTFKEHPWSWEANIVLAIHEPDHPTMRPFGGASVPWTDEIYIYTHWQPEKVRVLMSIDMEKTMLKRPFHVPISWVKEYGEGRVYYNNLGHRDDTWTKKPFLDSMLAGILWTSGRIDGPAEPNPELSAREEEKAEMAAKKSGN